MTERLNYAKLIIVTKLYIPFLIPSIDPKTAVPKIIGLFLTREEANTCLREDIERTLKEHPDVSSEFTEEDEDTLILGSELGSKVIYHTDKCNNGVSRFDEMELQYEPEITLKEGVTWSAFINEFENIGIYDSSIKVKELELADSSCLNLFSQDSAVGTTGT